jgi:hypothetical protein
MAITDLDTIVNLSFLKQLISSVKINLSDLWLKFAGCLLLLVHMMKQPYSEEWVIAFGIHQRCED